MNQRRSLWLILMLLAVLAFGGIVQAQQDAEPINIGDTVEGTLDEDNRRGVYEFEGQADSEVTITLTSDDFDAYLVLLDDSGEVLAEDDDSAGRLNSEIVYTLPGDATYTVFATSLREYTSDGEFFQAGEYSLSLSGDGAAPQEENTQEENTEENTEEENTEEQQNQEQPAGEGEMISVGDSVDGTLSEATPRASYTFEGALDQEVTITLVSEDFDAYLLLLDTNGDIIAEDDDSAGSLDSEISIALPDGGLYTIVATSLREYRSEGDEFATGDYTLTLSGEGGNNQTTEQPDNPPAEGEIAFDSPVDGTLDAAETTFDFSGSAGQTVTITLNSDEFDPYLQLRNSAGDVVAEDDDGAGRLNSQIVYTLEEDGTYTIAVTSFRAVSTEGEETATGAFTLELTGDGGTNNQTTQQNTTPADGTLAYGDNVEGTLEEAESAFTFDGASGDNVTITLLSTDFDPYLQLLDEGGNLLISDDDGAGQLNSQIVYTLPQDGSYTVVVTSYRAVSSEGEFFAEGAYTLSLSAGDVVTQQPNNNNNQTNTVTEQIAVGDTANGNLTDSVVSVEYTFEGEAGDLVSITLISDEFDPYLLLLDPNGVEIQRDDDSAGNLDSRIGPYSLPESGTYTIVASSYGHIQSGTPATGSYTVSVTAAVVDPIEYTQSVEGTVDQATPVVVYSFRGTQGDIVSLDFNSASTSAYARLTGGSTNIQGYGGTELIGPYVLPADGEYVVTVTSYDTFTPADFSLTLNRIEPLAIRYGYRSRTSFEEEGQSVLYFSIDGQIGDTLNVMVQSQGTVDTRLVLIGPGGFEVASDDDGGNGFDPELTYQITEAGTYQLVVRPYIAGDDGSFNLIVENASVPDLAAGEPQIVRLSDKQYIGSLVFDATAGETIRLNARLLTEITSEPRITVTQNGNILAEQSIGRVSSLLFEFVVPEDGRIEVSVQDYNGNPVVIEFTLEEAATPEGE